MRQETFQIQLIRMVEESHMQGVELGHVQLL